MLVEKTPSGVVVLDYADLVAGKDLSAAIAEGFGYHGIGLLTVKNVPRFAELRKKLLPLAAKFAALPEDIKEKTVHKESNFSIGWSHGKEMLSVGRYDTFKGSYYNNPQYRLTGLLYDVPTTDPNLIKEYPESCLPNIWPKEDFPALEPAFKELGQLIVSVGELVAKQCDAHVKKQLGDAYQTSLYEIIKTSRVCKARLLHYFPIKEDGPRARDSWCGWHNDHGSLTGLCPAMFMKEGDYDTEIPNPDPEAGLWVRTRAHREFRVTFPTDYLAFQIGESAQIMSGGVLRATPHAVQAVKWPESKDIVRDTFAVFMQPNFDVVMQLPRGKTETDAACSRFKEGMNFGQFSKVTIGAYY